MNFPLKFPHSHIFLISRVWICKNGVAPNEELKFRGPLGRWEVICSVFLLHYRLSISLFSSTVSGPAERGGNLRAVSGWLVLFRSPLEKVDGETSNSWWMPRGQFFPRMPQSLVPISQCRQGSGRILSTGCCFWASFSLLTPCSKSIVYFPGMWRQPANVNNLSSFSQSQAEGTMNFATLTESVWKKALDFWWLCSLRVPPESVAPSKLIFPRISKLLCVLSKHLCDLTHKRPISLPSRTRGRTQSCLLTALSGDQACPCFWVLDWDYPLATRCTMYAHLAPLSSVGCLWLLVHQSWKENACQGHVGLNPRMAFPELGGGPPWKMRLSYFWIPGPSTLPDLGGNG